MNHSAVQRKPALQHDDPSGLRSQFLQLFAAFCILHERQTNVPLCNLMHMDVLFCEKAKRFVPKAAENQSLLAINIAWLHVAGLSFRAKAQNIHLVSLQ